MDKEIYEIILTTHMNHSNFVIFLISNSLSTIVNYSPLKTSRHELVNKSKAHMAKSCPSQTHQKLINALAKN